MAFAWLIDGYNLLGALGLIQGDLGPAGLERGRRQLLDHLADRLKAESSRALIVFDAFRKPRRAQAEQEHRGLQIRFARGEADDLIEELMHAYPQRERLTVVSSDHRLHRAARRLQVRVLDCDAFLDELEEKRRTPGPPAEADAKPIAGEKEHWLREFADLENEPGIKELFDDHGTGDAAQS